ncbi:MAG: YihY/virulence factor BrkB family protein [Firmicutes bacterium]|nr:YihY/virulence factor BrkB family protein [Bacillota bacterium]
MKATTIRAGKRVKKMFLLMIHQFQEPYYQGVAAQIAFSLFLSIIPILILLSQLLGLFSLSLEELRDWVEVNVSVEGADQLLSLIEYSPSGVNSLFLGIVAVWSASRVQFSLSRVANYTFTDGEVIGQGFLRDRLKSMRTVIITIFTVAFSLVVFVYGELIINLIFGQVVGEELSTKAWLVLRWPLAWAMYFLMISYNYYILPTHKTPFKDVIPGSIFSAIGFLVVTYVYALYTSRAANYDILYGSLSNIVALMFWFWFLAWVMCLGITFNRVWWATRPTNNIPISEEAKARRKPLNII